jgi:PAS domain S-box-containing protein
LITDPGGQILHANVAARNMFRMTERELCVAGNAGVTDASDPRLQTLITQRRRDGKVQGELTLIRKGGEKFPAHITTSVFTDSVGQERMSIIIRDIVRLKDSETSLQKVNRELYLLNNANKLILKAFDEQTLMQQMCDLLVAEGNYKMCWIGLMPDRKSHFLVTPLTFAGSGENYIGEVKINLEDPKQMNGPTAKAMRSGQAVIVNHIAEDPDYIPWKKSAAKYGYASSASFPLILEKQVIASLNIYSSDVQSFDPEEVDILTAITDNLSYAIKGIRNTNNKKIAEKKLNDNEQNLQIIFSSTYDIIFMLSVEPFNRFKFMSINDAFLTTTGLKAEQVFDKYLDEVIPPDSLPMILEKYEAAVSSNKAMQWEETSQYPSGSKTGLVTITPVSDENGKPHRLVGFVHDITERKKAEEDMDRMNNQLRQLSNHIQTIGESERTAIAREIHDVLGQQMTALKYDIAWLKKKRNAAEADILQRIESMNKLVDETILSIRKVSSELRPKILDDLGLNAAIEWYVAAFEKNTGIRTEIDSDLEDISFEKLVSITIYRILQEALTNVARHAKAAKVHVSAKLKNNTIFLEVRDNGKGIAENEKQNTTSFGLLGISERAKMIGGDVIIQGIKGKGTSVLLKLPLHKNDTK